MKAHHMLPASGWLRMLAMAVMVLLLLFVMSRTGSAQAAHVTDGDPGEWDAVPALDLPLPSLDGTRTVDARLQVDFDDENVYVLVSIDDDYNSTPGDHEASGSLAVQWAIDPGAGPHMGTDGVDIQTSLGMVDLWHWEIDCGPGVLSGGVDRTEDGNDPVCNLDDEYANSPFDRHDDDGDNFLQGAYGHSGQAAGENAAGTWYWEMERPRTTTEAQDVQLTGDGPFLLALAYWDGDETVDGWTDSGHLQSADAGWISVTAGQAPSLPEPHEPVVTANGGVCIRGLVAFVVEAPSGSAPAAAVSDAIEAECGLAVQRLWLLERGNWLLFVPGIGIDFGLTTFGPLSAVLAVLA